MIISIHYYNGISRFYFLMHTNLSWSIPDLCQDLRALSIPLNDLPGLLSWSNRIAFQRKNRLAVRRTPSLPVFNVAGHAEVLANAAFDPDAFHRLPPPPGTN